MTNRFTRAWSICGSCAGKSGTLSADCGDGIDAVGPGCDRNTLRPQSIPAIATPPLIRNLLRVSDLFMDATLGRAREIYFSNLAIFFGHDSVIFSPCSRRHSEALVKQCAE